MMGIIGSTIARLLGRAPKDMLKRELPRSVVTHDSLDELTLGNLLEDSPRFREETIGSPPKVPVSVPKPEPIDVTSATPEQLTQYQKEARAYREAEEQAEDYRAWGELTGDVYRSLHTHEEPKVIEEVDADVALHQRIMQKLLSDEDHAEMRNTTRDAPIPAAVGTMAILDKVREALDGELSEQVREQEEVRELREKAAQHQQQLESHRNEAKSLHDTGKPIPPELVQQIKDAVAERQAAAVAASQIAESPTPMSLGAAEALSAAAQAGREAAEAAAGVPSFGAGMGAGEPTYTSPEQAISIAEQWATNPDLRKMAELFGRLDRDIRFKRSKRVVGGNDEIIDVKLGDDLRRTIPAEFALLADATTEDDFLSRYTTKELLEYQTVGEEHAGRGPILIVLDGSGSMGGERNIWSRAVAMCMLHIARLEKRDFALIEFSSGGQVCDWLFRAKEPMPADKVLDMASHFFGGGTTPIIGMQRALDVMKAAAPFRKADVVLVGDGESAYGPEDDNIRKQFQSMGVRIFGIGIGGSFRYIKDYTEPDGYMVDVHDFDLSDPSTATAELATHIT